jgi:apolipoprotein N-acyltransferase
VPLAQTARETLLTILSGLLFGLSFPPYGWFALAWLALAPFFVALRAGSTRQALLLAWLWSLVASYAVGDWFPRAVAGYFQQPLLVAVALYFVVFSLMAGVYYMAFAVVYRRLARSGAWLLPLLAAAAWVAAEIGRGRLFTGTSFFIGNPWGLIGYSQTEALPLVQIAAVTGIYGVSFAVVCANAALAEVWIAWRARDLTLHRAALLLATAVTPGLAVAVYGATSLEQADAISADAAAVPIAIVQGNIALSSRWRSDSYGRNLDVYLELSHEAAQQSPKPQIIFWPESAMTFFLEDEPLYRQAVARVLGHDDVELVTGGVRAVGEADKAFFNSVYALAPDGSIAGRYDKQHLVPFAEFFPLSIDLLRRRFGRIRYFEAGTSAEPIPTRAGPAGVVVCNETMLPEVVAERVDHGAVYLVNPTNDSWISDAKYTQQQFDIAVLRAIEQRRYLVRASTAGPSAVIDPWGRAQRQVAPLTRGVVQGEVRAIEERSLYGRVGDLFALLCIAAVGVALVVQRPSSAADSRPATR